jgi:hypothetical protein
MTQLRLMRFWIRERPAGSKEPDHYVILGGAKGCAQIRMPGEWDKSSAEYIVDALNNAADKVEAKEIYESPIFNLVDQRIEKE